MSAAKPQPAVPKPARRRYQYSLRTLLCLPVIVAIFLGLGSILAARDGILAGWREAWFSLGLVVTAASIWKRRWLIACVGALLVLSNMPGFQVPTSAETPGAMHMMKRRILRYAHTHNQLPESVAQLPVIEGYDNRTVDAWGRDIQYEVQGDCLVLTSYGRDGVVGGAGPDADIIRVFRARDDKGNWNRELVDWSRDPPTPP